MKGEQLKLFNTENNLKKQKNIVLPLDTFILLGIIIILLFILIFSLGIERGKKIPLNLSLSEKKIEIFNTTENGTENIIEKNLTPENYRDEQKITSDIKKTQQLVDIEKKDTEGTETNKNNNGSLSNFVIQIASYTNEKIAYEELRKIEKNGFPVFLSKINKYWVIFVGKFKDKREAEKSKKILEKKYKDCFIRRF